jgi:hypothetical protein
MGLDSGANKDDLRQQNGHDNDATRRGPTALARRLRLCAC